VEWAAQVQARAATRSIGGFMGREPGSAGAREYLSALQPTLVAALRTLDTQRPTTGEGEAALSLGPALAEALRSTTGSSATTAIPDSGNGHAALPKEGGLAGEFLLAQTEELRHLLRDALGEVNATRPAAPAEVRSLACALSC
jgi:hypothetical protein